MVNKTIKKATTALLSIAGLSTTAWATTTIQDTYVNVGYYTAAGKVDQIGLVGDSGSTFAFADTTADTIDIAKITADGQVAKGQHLKSDSTGSTEFARTVDLWGDSKIGNHMLVGDNKFAYYYTGGEWNGWSVQQIFKSADYPTGNFGQSAVFNRVNNQEFAVACPTCVTNAGAVYVYEKEGPKNIWTQSAMLTAAQTTPAVHCDDSTANLGDVVKISGDNILAVNYFNACGSLAQATLFSRRRGQWSQQQNFWSAIQDNSKIAVERDTIVIGSPGASNGLTTLVGAVYVQYPNTPEYGAKPQPGVATQWSLHQVLYPPTAVASSFFGDQVTVQGNRLYVGASGNSPTNTNIYVFERESLGGYWSLQQTLNPPTNTKGFSNHVISGELIVGLPTTTSSPKASPAIYDNRQQWKCIVISLEDQFGDGWDTAKLQVTSPNGETDLYSPFCNTPNPLEIRYCPTIPTPESQGTYKLSILDGPKSKFFWEIQWRVFEESTGKWYRGNHATKMDFHFDVEGREFSRRGIFHDLPSNVTCVTCPGKPEEKPQPKPRALKSDTHAPSVSPAPTLAQTVIYGDAWRYLTLKTTSDPWFNNEHKGTNYYISDTQGHKLISTGTSCLSTPALCYQVIPDGQYVLRVSGGLDKHYNQHTWSFCGRQGGAKEQLDFVVKDGKCDAIISYTQSTYCSAVLHSAVLSSIQLEIFGVSETTAIEELSTADLKALSTAISSLVGHGVSPSDVKLSAITNQFGHAIFDVTVAADASNFGADPHDLDSMENVVAQLGTIFANSASTGQLLTALTSTTIPGATFLQNLQAVQFLSATLSSIDATAESDPTSMVTDIAETTTTSEPTESNDKLFYIVVAGYVACVVALIGLVVYAYNQIGSTSVRAPGASSTSTISTAEIKSEPTTQTTTTSGPVKSTRKQLPKSVDSTQKSQQMNTIMIADLIQMVKEEDEQLQQTMSSDHFRV